MAERLDIFTSLFDHIGSEDRNIVHSKGLWHQTFHCWLIRKRENSVYLLFQKRASQKADFPNLLDIPAAGHLSSGECKEDGVRELKEELGVKVVPEMLHYLGVRVEAIEIDGFNNKEFQHVYLLEDNTDISDYTLQDGEVSGIVEIELVQGLKLLYREIDEIQCDSVLIEDGNSIRKIRTFKLSDFIPRFDGYYKNIFIMSDLLFKGYKYLSI